MMPEAATPQFAPATEDCANCGVQLTGPFCAECGQSAESIKRPALELLEHALESLLDFDSRGLRSLGLLLARPGRMTALYLSGQRARFVPPIRLYLFTSLIFFLTIWATNTAIVQFVGFRTVAGTPSVAFRLFAPLVAASPDPQSLDIASSVQIEAGQGEPPAFVGRMIAGLERALKEPTALNGRMSELFPKMIFALVPVFGLILWLLYMRRRRFLIEHLIFALHFHAFAFLLFTAVIALRPILPSETTGGLFLVLAALYLSLALKRVYGQGWIKTAVKEILLLVLYGVFFVAGMLVLLVAGLGEI
jgi:hypothetical protein